MDISKLQEWKCHKIVRAARIVRVGPDSAFPTQAHELDLEGGQTYSAGTAAAVWGRGLPVVGDYLVVYDGGYVSFSPAKAFEEGYARIGRSIRGEPLTATEMKRAMEAEPARITETDKGVAYPPRDWRCEHCGETADKCIGLARENLNRLIAEQKNKANKN